jgi:hypothetical protein
MSRTVGSAPAEVHSALGGELHPAQRPPAIVRECNASAIPRGVAVHSQVNSARPGIQLSLRKESIQCA